MSGDVNALGRVGGGPNPLDFTPINKFANERLGGIRDGGMEFTSFFDKANDAAHEALASLPLTDRHMTYLRGTSLGSPAASIVAKQGNYDYERGEDGTLVASVEALANGYGLQWGNQLTAGRRVDTVATNGTGVDFGVGSTTFGLQAFLHVVAFTGTDVTIRLQESSDNGADAYANVAGGAFASVTGVGAQRIATASGLTVERFLRAVTSTTGGFTSIDFVVVAIRNDTAVAF